MSPRDAKWSIINPNRQFLHAHFLVLSLYPTLDKNAEASSFDISAVVGLTLISPKSFLLEESG